MLTRFFHFRACFMWVLHIHIHKDHIHLREVVIASHEQTKHLCLHSLYKCLQFYSANTIIMQQNTQPSRQISLLNTKKKICTITHPHGSRGRPQITITLVQIPQQSSVAFFSHAISPLWKQVNCVYCPEGNWKNHSNVYVINYILSCYMHPSLAR